MLITCETCNVKCPSLTRWHGHLLSKGHQVAVVKQIKSIGAINTPATHEVTTSLFILQLRKDEINSTRLWRSVREAVHKFSHYGFIHSFYMDTDMGLLIFILELRHGITNYDIIKAHWKNDFGTLTLTESISSDEWKSILSKTFVFEEYKNTEIEVELQSLPGECFNSGIICSSSDSQISESPEGDGAQDVNDIPKQNTKLLNFKELNVVDSMPFENLESGFHGIGAGGFDQELLHFLNQAQLTTAQKEIRMKFLENLTNCLRKLFQNCQLFPFGSFLTGLGDKSSDLDALITGYDAETPPSDQVVRNLRNFLQKQVSENGSRRYKKIEMMLKTNVKLIRFVESSTNISCDLSFSNYLALRNSELISFLLNLDGRARDLAMFARQWGKFYELTDSTKLKNYALVLLVFVFCARKKILPAIHTLQKMGKVEEIDGWNAGFCRDISNVLVNVSKSRSPEESYYDHTVTFLELARDFFEMFSKDISNGKVICTLTAESYDKSVFNNGFDNLPEELSRLKNRPTSCKSSKKKFKLKFFNIQDPFDLESNLGKSVSKKLYRKLVFTVQETAKYFSSIVEIDEEHKIKVATLFPKFVIPQDFTVTTGNSGKSYKRYTATEIANGALDRITTKIEDVYASAVFQQAQMRIQQAKKFKPIEFGLTEEFAEIFFEHDENILGHEPSELRELLMFELWCKFAHTFVTRAWDHCYFMKHSEVVLLDEMGLAEQSKRPNRSQETEREFPIFCSSITVSGRKFPPGMLFGVREDNKIPTNMEINPLDEERRIREQILKGLYRKKGKENPDFVWKWLLILEIDEDGPFLSLLPTATEPLKPINEDQLGKMYTFITSGIKRMFFKYQVHLLHKWTTNSHDLTLL